MKIPYKNTQTMSFTGPVKWISKWRGHETLKSIFGYLGWPKRKILNSRRSRMTKKVTFWTSWQPLNSFCFETLSFFLFFPFSLLRKNWWGHGLVGPLQALVHALEKYIIFNKTTFNNITTSVYWKSFLFQNLNLIYLGISNIE